MKHKTNITLYTVVAALLGASAAPCGASKSVDTPSLSSLIRTQDYRVLDSSLQAACASGKKFEALEILADRLDNLKDSNLRTHIINSLVCSCIADCDQCYGFISTKDVDWPKRLKSAWKIFLSNNEAILRSGIKLKVGDRRLMTDLCPRGFRISTGWMQEWPDQFQLILKDLNRPFNRNDVEQCRDRAQVAVDSLQEIVDFDNGQLNLIGVGRRHSHRQPKKENQLLLKALWPLAEAYRSAGEDEAATAVTSQIKEVSAALDKPLRKIKIDYLARFEIPPPPNKYQQYFR